MPNWRQMARNHLAGARLRPPRLETAAEELALHLEARYRERLAAGDGEAEARTAAMAELAPAPRGGWDGGSPWRDLREAARRLRRAPAFTAAAVLCLGLGIGANVAIFSVNNALVLRPLPVYQPGRLAEVRIVDRHRAGSAIPYGELTERLYRRLAVRQRAFSGLAAWAPGWALNPLNTAASGAAHYVQGIYVSGNFFSVLGLQPAAGRLFTPGDDYRGCSAPGVVLGYSYWQHALAGEPLAGHTLTLNRHVLPILGVAPRGFTGPEAGNRFDVALPLCAEPLMDGDGAFFNNPVGWWLDPIGRLRPGWNLQRASAQLAALSPSLFAATVPAIYSPRDRATYLRHRLQATSAATGVSLLRGQVSRSLWLLLALAAAVLLIAAANLANLLLVRANGRRQEHAVRLALGASRGSLARQALAESLWLALGSAALGALVAAAAAPALAHALDTGPGPAGPGSYFNLTPGWHLFVALTACAAAACALLALAPALAAGRIAPTEALKSGGRSVASRGGLRRGLTIVQVALALALLATSILFTRSLRSLAATPTGFHPRHVLVVNTDLAPLHLPVTARLAFERRLLGGLDRIPGVASTAALRILPVSGNSWNGGVRIAPAGRAPGTARAVSFFNRISPGYFRAMGAHLLAGRDFLSSDTTTSPRVAIVTQAFARKFLAGADPVGRQLQIQGGGGKWGPAYQIVGVAANEKYAGLDQSMAPLLFRDTWQNPRPSTSFQFAIRSPLDAGPLESAVAAAIGRIAPDLSLQFTPFQQEIRSDLANTRLLAALATAFAVLALLLAAIGIYGVLAYRVNLRRREIGLRVALGASRRQAAAVIVNEAAVLVGLGAALGLVLAYLAGRAARSLLFGIGPANPWALALAISGLLLTALAAAWMPAHRAACLPPMDVLREE